MLLDNNIVTDGQTKSGAFAGRLGREEGIEYLFLHVWRNAGAIVPDCYFDTVTQVSGCGNKSWLIVAVIGFCCPLGRSVKAIGDQIEQNPSDILRKQIDLAGGWIKQPLQGDGETLLLGPRPVVGEVEAFFNKGVDINRPVFT